MFLQIPEQLSHLSVGFLSEEGAYGIHWKFHEIVSNYLEVEEVLMVVPWKLHNNDIVIINDILWRCLGGLFGVEGPVGRYAGCDIGT